MRWLGRLVLACWLAAGCSSGSTASSADARDASLADRAEATEPQPDVRVQPECSAESLNALFLSAWPGRGLQVVVRSRGTGRTSPEEGSAASFSLLAGGTRGLPAEVAAMQLPRAFGLVLFDAASGSEAGQALRGAALELLGRLPPDMRVALYRRCAALHQVAAFTPDRQLLADLVTAENLGCADRARLPMPAALEAAMTEAAVAGGPSYPALRSVFLLAETEALGDLEPVTVPIGVDGYGLLMDGAAGLDVPPLAAFAWDQRAGPAAVLDQLAAAVDKAAAYVYSVGTCLPAGFDGPLSLANEAGVACQILTPPSGPSEERSLPCDPAAAAAGERKYPERVELIFTPEEKAAFDGIYADKAKDDFSLAVRLGDAEPVAATAHLRGQTSLDCERKNFSVNLKGPIPRHIRPFFASDQFYLVSMCKDNRYFHGLTGYLLADDLGLYPLSRGLVELVVDGKSFGVYMVLEKKDKGVLEERSRVRAIVRRRFDPEDKVPDIEYPPDTAADDPAIDAYWDLVPGLEGLEGDALIEECGKRFDLDQFLTMLAFDSLMGNGDYIDEVLFYSTEAVREGKVGEWFQFMCWDLEDLYISCHHSGKFAMPDAYGMLFCAEGDLEKRIMSDPKVYARFVDILEDMILNRVTAETLDAALEKTAGLLLPFFDRPEVCAAMVELVKSNPAATDPEVARTDIKDKMDEMKKKFAARRDELLGKIDAYRKDAGDR